MSSLAFRTAGIAHSAISASGRHSVPASQTQVMLNMACGSSNIRKTQLQALPGAPQG